MLMLALALLAPLGAAASPRASSSASASTRTGAEAAVVKRAKRAVARQRRARRAAAERRLHLRIAGRRPKKPAPAPAPTPTPTPTPTPAPSPAPAPAPAPEPSVLFADAFPGPDGVITSADAFWNPNDSTLARDPGWEGESGTMLRRGETAWSSTASTRMFRFWTKRSDFDNVRVEMDLRTNGFHPGDASMPAVDWDGVKIWLRRQVVNGSSSGNGKPALYVAEVNRRQGNVIVQKKCGGQDAYTTLANTSWSGRPNPPRIGVWERVGGAVRTNADGTVTIEVIRDGAVVLTGTDRGGNGCAPITTPAKVGVRGDNTDFNFDNVTVTPR